MHIANHRALRFAREPGNFLNFLPACLDRDSPAACRIQRTALAGGVCRHAGDGIRFSFAPRWEWTFPSTCSIRPTSGGGDAVAVPEVGFAPPYHFTENITGLWDWGLPCWSGVRHSRSRTVHGTTAARGRGLPLSFRL